MKGKDMNKRLSNEDIFTDCISKFDLMKFIFDLAFTGKIK